MMRSLTLLVQLFGREMMDGVFLAGFDSAIAIAMAGPERLALEGGIPLSLARRIVAVAMESQELEHLAPAAPPAATPAETPMNEDDRAAEPAAGGRDQAAAPVSGGPAVPSEAPPATVEKHVRRPLKRPGSALAPGGVARPAPGKRADRAPDPVAPSKGATRPEAAPRPETAAGPKPAAQAAGPVALEEAELPSRPCGEAEASSDPDPFVDDVALVSWMGFSARRGGGRSFTVADDILEPGPPSFDARGLAPDTEPPPSGRGAPAKARAARRVPIEEKELGAPVPARPVPGGSGVVTEDEIERLADISLLEEIARQDLLLTDDPAARRATTPAQGTTPAVLPLTSPAPAESFWSFGALRPRARASSPPAAGSTVRRDTAPATSGASGAPAAGPPRRRRRDET